MHRADGSRDADAGRSADGHHAPHAVRDRRRRRPPRRLRRQGHRRRAGRRGVRAACTSGTAGRSSCCGPGCRPTSSSPRSSSACWPPASSGCRSGRRRSRSCIGTGLGVVHPRRAVRPRPGATACRRWCSRGSPFGWFGNALPAGLNAVIAGIGWFAVNSVSGALALNSLTGMPSWLCLLIVVVAPDRDRLLRPQPGADLRAVRRPGARRSSSRSPASMTFVKADYGGAGQRRGPRRLPAHRRRDLRLRRRLEPLRRRLHPLPAADTSKRAHRPVRRARRLRLLHGAGAGRRGLDQHRDRQGPQPDDGVHLAPRHRASATSPCWPSRSARSRRTRSTSTPGALSFTAMGFQPAAQGGPGDHRRGLRRARPDRGAAWASRTSRKYENFLLVISYWIGPWLGVLLRRLVAAPRRTGSTASSSTGKHRPCAGWVAMLVGDGASRSGCSPTRRSTPAWSPRHVPEHRRHRLLRRLPDRRRRSTRRSSRCSAGGSRRTPSWSRRTGRGDPVARADRRGRPASSAGRSAAEPTADHQSASSGGSRTSIRSPGPRHDDLRAARARRPRARAAPARPSGGTPG